MWRRVWIWRRELRTRTTYCLQWYDERGRRRTESVGTDLTYARQRARRREYEINSGPDVAERRLREFTEEHVGLLRLQVRPASLASHRAALDRLAEHCGDVRLSALTPARIERFVAWRLEHGRRPATVNKEVRTLRAAFGRAVSRGYLRANPCAGVRPLRELRAELRALTTAEVSRLFVACGDAQFRVFLALALTTGLRRGELLALEWEDVDVERARVAVRNKPAHLVKSGQERAQPVPAETVRMLSAWRARRADGRLFDLTGRDALRALKRLCARARVRACTVHDLRRTYASSLATQASSLVVRRLAGHASIATTERYYAGVDDATLRRAAGRLPYLDVVTLSQQAPPDGSGAKSVAG